MENFLKRVQMIQEEIKAPKNLTNTYSGYNYRNAESILEAFKPFGKKYSMVLTLEDSIEQVGHRFYVKSTATLQDTESDQFLSKSAYARETEERKGNDPAQITGATSSYARKYALNGLLLLDDTKDADSDDCKKERDAKEVKAITEDMRKAKDELVTAEQIAQIKTILINDGKKEKDFCDYYKIKKLNELPFKKAVAYIEGHKGLLSGN